MPAYPVHGTTDDTAPVRRLHRPSKRRSDDRIGERQGLMITYALLCCRWVPRNLEEAIIPLTDELDLFPFQGQVKIIQASIDCARILLAIKDVRSSLPCPIARRRQVGCLRNHLLYQLFPRRFCWAELPRQQGNVNHRISFLAESICTCSKSSRSWASRGWIEPAPTTRWSSRSGVSDLQFSWKTFDVCQTTWFLDSLGYIKVVRYLHRYIWSPNIGYQCVDRLAIYPHRFRARGSSPRREVDTRQ